MSYLLAQTSKSFIKKILNEVYEKINKPSTFYVDFTYQYKNKKCDLINSEKGKIYLSDNKYLISFMGITYIDNGEKFYTISNKDKEITISSTKNIKNIISPIQILLDYYMQNFNINNCFKYKKSREKTLILLKFTPKKKCSVKELHLVLENKKLKEIHEIENNGYITNIIINNYILGTIVSKTFIEFKKENYTDYIITQID